MRLRPILIVATSVLALAACASKPKTPASVSAPPPTPAAETPFPSGDAPSDPSVAAAQQDLAARAGDRVYFALDSHELGDAARATLERQADWFASHPTARARIEGHADERGTREYNLALGARRATAVRQFLISRGVSPARLETISFGKERPIDPGSGEAAWARNRNAHTVVTGVSVR